MRTSRVNTSLEAKWWRQGCDLGSGRCTAGRVVRSGRRRRRGCSRGRSSSTRSCRGWAGDHDSCGVLASVDSCLLSEERRCSGGAAFTRTVEVLEGDDGCVHTGKLGRCGTVCGERQLHGRIIEHKARVDVLVQLLHEIDTSVAATLMDTANVPR